jgi:cytochrome b561
MGCSGVVCCCVWQLVWSGVVVVVVVEVERTQRTTSCCRLHSFTAVSVLLAADTRTMTATTTTTPALVPSENILSAKVSHSCHPSHVQCTR